MTIVLRSAILADGWDLWQWRNDEQTRKNSRNPALIPWERHEAWFIAALANQYIDIQIALERRASVGMVRYDRRETFDIEVSIVVAPEARGRGLGTAILRAGCAYVSTAYPCCRLRAVVNVDNFVSQRLFEMNGFSREISYDEPGFFGYRKLALV
jgi:UDP-2,4-diacetamido-2,4,6-trideoxy-beta-L-altropyranose hydrolase